MISDLGPDRDCAFNLSVLGFLPKQLKDSPMYHAYGMVLQFTTIGIIFYDSRSMEPHVLGCRYGSEEFVSTVLSPKHPEEDTIRWNYRDNIDINAQFYHFS